MIEINLLPVQKSWTLLWLKVTCSLFLLTLVIFLGLTWMNWRLEGVGGSPLGSARGFQEENRFDDWALAMEQLQTDLTQLDTTISRLKGDSLEKKISFLRMLAEQLPEKIWLTKIEVKDKGELFIQGESMEYGQILRWIDLVKGMDMIQNVSLLSLEGHEVLCFSIQLEMGGDQG